MLQDLDERFVTAFESIAQSLEYIAHPLQQVMIPQGYEVVDSTPGPGGHIALQEKAKPKKKKRPRHNPEYTEEFLEFWEAYPKPVAKAKAAEAWDQVEESRPENVVEKVRLYARQVRKTDPKYIKHPATWLRGHCWADDIAEGMVTSTGPTGTHTVSVSRTVATESIEHYSDPLWPEYRDLVTAEKIKPGFVTWKETRNG